MRAHRCTHTGTLVEDEAEEAEEGHRQDVDAVRGAEAAALSAAVRILPFSGESTASASLPTETTTINFTRKEVRHDGRRPGFKVAFISGLRVKRCQWQMNATAE